MTDTRDPHALADTVALPTITAIFAFTTGEDDLVLHFTSAEQYNSALQEISEATGIFAIIENIDAYPTLVRVESLLVVTPYEHSAYLKLIQQNEQMSA